MAFPELEVNLVEESSSAPARVHAAAPPAPTVVDTSRRAVDVQDYGLQLLNKHGSAGFKVTQGARWDDLTSALRSALPRFGLSSLSIDEGGASVLRDVMMSAAAKAEYMKLRLVKVNDDTHDRDWKSHPFYNRMFTSRPGAGGTEVCEIDDEGEEGAPIGGGGHLWCELGTEPGWLSFSVPQVCQGLRIEDQDGETLVCTLPRGATVSWQDGCLLQCDSHGGAASGLLVDLRDELREFLEYKTPIERHSILGLGHAYADGYSRHCSGHNFLLAVKQGPHPNWVLKRRLSITSKLKTVVQFVKEYFHYDIRIMEIIGNLVGPECWPGLWDEDCAYVKWSCGLDFASGGHIDMRDVGLVILISFGNSAKGSEWVMPGAKVWLELPECGIVVFLSRRMHCAAEAQVHEGGMMLALYVSLPNLQGTHLPTE